MGSGQQVFIIKGPVESFSRNLRGLLVQSTCLAPLQRCLFVVPVSRYQYHYHSRPSPQTFITATFIPRNLRTACRVKHATRTHSRTRTCTRTGAWTSACARAHFFAVQQQSLHDRAETRNRLASAADRGHLSIMTFIRPAHGASDAGVGRTHAATDLGATHLR